MAELLLELLSEEIPARMQMPAAAALERDVSKRLAEAGLAFTKAAHYATPRRLTLVVEGLPTRQPDRKEERKGPRVGAPEQAIKGFLKSAGLTSLEQCEIRTVKGNEYYIAVTEWKGKKTEDVLEAIIAKVLLYFRWPKSMRWYEGGFSWVRPLHSICVVFDGKPWDHFLQLGAGRAKLIERNIAAPDPAFPLPIPITGATRGHRFLAPEPFAVTDFADYAAKLKKAHVILDPAERRAIIEKDAAKLAGKAKLTLRDDPALLDEVTGLVEWPVVLMGAIDAAFMDVPPEVLTSAMRNHQKYFSLETAAGALAPRFIVVANMAADGGKAIVAGNERVLRARLSDARFFWDQDRKQPLAVRVAALEKVVFHARLGSLYDKTERVRALAAEIAGFVPGADPGKARAAARLAKADLTTEMVGEFPELQGIMGRYYARHDGEDEDVARAIAEHYAPQGPNDACPTAPVSICVALADKLDTLVGFWAIDEKPTGSKDPYALRRAALGVIRLVLENTLRLPLSAVFVQAFEQVRQHAEAVTGAAPTADLLAFFADRLKAHLRAEGVRHDLIDAVFSLGGEDDLVRLMARVRALADFLESSDGANLLVAYRRAANIVRIEEKKDERAHDGAPDPARLEADAETALHDALLTAAGTVAGALADEEFVAAMAALATLRAPVDRFFDDVTVNCDDGDLRENRLRLLAQIRVTMDRVADFSKIEG